MTCDRLLWTQVSAYNQSALVRHKIHKRTPTNPNTTKPLLARKRY